MPLFFPNHIIIIIIEMVITNPKFLNRLNKEYNDIKTKQNYFDVQLVDNNLQHWRIKFVGPHDTAYEGLPFELDILIGVVQFILTDFVG